MKGGNAIDAAVAVASTLNVVEIYMSGIDGNGFTTIYWAPEKKVYALAMTGAVPYAADPEKLTKEDLATGYKAGCVPGNFGGWIAALQRFGTMSLKEIMEPAINYAEGGFPVSPAWVSWTESTKTVLELYPSSARVFLPNGKVPQVGEIFYLKDLANTFKKLVAAEQTALQQGKSREEALQAAFDRFYTGDIAQEMVSFYQENGGLFTAKDFADYKPMWKEPLHGTYRGYDVYISPSTSRSGYEVLMQLNLIEGFNLKELGHNSAAYLHLVYECIKLAKADVYHYVADEKFTEIPTTGMLSKEYAALRRQLIDPNKAMVYPAAGNPKDFQTKGLVPVYSTALQISDEGYEDSMQTTNFDVIDRFGNAVGSTVTHGNIFGTGVVIGNTGLLFNNGTRWGSTAPYPDNVNAVQGGKISLLGNSPTVVMKDGELFMVYGSPGGEAIGQAQFNVILNIIDFGMGIQEAIEAARGALTAKPDFYIPGAEITVGLESRVSPEVVKELETKGHKILVKSEFGGGNMVQGILVDPVYGTWTAGADPRGEAYAVGW
jgi:gamma-glutamyltranspeptidase/glutathione hydrolase